jgi:transglutaminase-like putative cysteine protease
VMDLVMLAVPQKLISSLTAETDNNFLLRKFTFLLTSGIITFTANGTMRGKTMQLKIESNGVTQEKTVHLSDPPSLAGSMRYAMARSGLAPGAVLQRTVFDPLTMSNRTIQAEVEKLETITIRGQQQICFRIRESFNGITVYAWLNQKGETVKEESPMGFVMLQEPRAMALAGNNEGKKIDIISTTGIAPDKPIPQKNIAYLRLRLKHVNLDGFHLDGGRQKRTGDIVEIRRENLDMVRSYHLPCTDKRFGEYLKATLFIQSTDTNIVAMARQIIGAEQDARTAAQKICKWMQSAVEKIPTMSVPSAAEVLRSRKGDCNEHAVLFAALCRAGGIPARICAGIVYVNGSFYYHAWNEVYLDGWVSIDSTLNQIPADVTHVKFVEGDLEQQILILKIVGKMAVDVLEYS